MSEWNRESVVWRQGHLLSQTDVQRLGLVLPEYSDSTLVLLVSHDCDIANDATREPDVEVVLGYLVDESNPNYVFGKNPRLLELPFQNLVPLQAQFNIQSRQAISKDNLQHCTPNTAHLEQRYVRVLQGWLASRYDRPAFPDEFDSLIKDERISTKLAKLGVKYGSLVSGLLFDLRESTDIYHLGILVLYVSNSEPIKAYEIAQTYIQEITKAFEARFFDSKAETWKSIELTYCRAISEDNLTFSQARDYQRWNLDAVSYAADPQQALPID